MLFNLQARLQNIKLVTSLSGFIKRPESLESVFAVANSLQGSPLAAQMERHLINKPQFKALVDEGWRPKSIDLVELQKLPDGSLGRCYADQLIRLGITPDVLIDPAPISTTADFIRHRLAETHDIIHVLTGFGIDGCGEIGLQGFNLAQTRSPLAVLLIFGSMLSTLQDDESMEPLLRALSKGFQIGLDADLVIAQKLEEGWDRPISDWRRHLNLPTIQ